MSLTDTRVHYVIVKLTRGGLANNYIRLTRVMSFFPSSVIGGGSIEFAAPRCLEIHYGAASPAFTDIDKAKKFFRGRAWSAAFFAMHRLTAGDRVVIEKTGPLQLHVYPLRVLPQ